MQRNAINRLRSLPAKKASFVEPMECLERMADLPDGTVVDGELVAIDDSGRPDFHLLQNFRAEASRIHYYISDLLCCKDRDLTHLSLIGRRDVPARPQPCHAAGMGGSSHR